MSMGLKFKKFAGMFFLCLAVACLGDWSAADTASHHSQRKAKKAPLPPLPSGPTGPVPQIPLDSMKPVAPLVSYENGQLTIDATNSTLGDILRAVRKQTGAEIEIPDAPDRVVTHLGPGPAREVVADLLNGSRFNYVLLGSPTDDAALTHVVLVAKSGQDTNNAVVPQSQPGMQAGNMPTPREMPPDANDADAADDNNVDESADQAAAAAEADQSAAPDQPGVKTPQQLLQEMQQRQLQLQQQQPPGQPPIPGAGRPPGPPQE